MSCDVVSACCIDAFLLLLVALQLERIGAAREKCQAVQIMTVAFTRLRPPYLAVVAGWRPDIGTRALRQRTSHARAEADFADTNIWSRAEDRYSREPVGCAWPRDMHRTHAHTRTQAIGRRP